MRRNPLLYSDPSEIEETDLNQNSQPQASKPESSLLFYFIIFANSLLVLFVLGFIWFLFFKSPDLQLRELSNRYLGTSLAIETATEPEIITPQITPEIVITPTQQEKDEVQQAQLKQMREKEEQELAAERAKLEAIKAELEKEKARANEAQEALKSLKAATPESQAQDPIASPSSTDKTIDSEIQNAITNSDTLPSATTNQPNTETEPASAEPTVVPNATVEPDATNPNSTSSQVDLIMEALRIQQQENTASEN